MKTMSEDSILNFDGYLKNSVLYRDDLGIVCFDLQQLKENFLEDYEEFLNKPKKYLERLKECLKINFVSESILDVGEREIDFKIKNFDIIHPISHLRVEHVGDLVNIKGMVTKTTKVVAIVIKQKFECPSCGTMLILEGNREPNRCSCGRRGSFHLVNQTLQDVQEIELEELQDELEGRQPNKIRVRLLDKLTDKSFSGILQPGNKISILGFLEPILVNKSNKDETMFEYRINAVEIIPLDEQFIEELISEEDLEQIKEISSDDPLLKLSKSLAPGIFGYDEVKKSLVLQMVGGVKKKKFGGTYTRDRIHLLLCGDPGLSKSQLAKNVNLRMPKSYYISGDSTTKAGLVAITERDELLKTFSLKAGALCKANDSILIIDEMDKFNEEDREGLHTPMESGEIIVNKADIHTKLKAECAILGIANPKNGLFELGEKTFVQQIDLPAPLMSRFDLIFVMTDKIDEGTDESIVKSIYSQDESESEITIELFRKYISYARKLRPKLLKEHLGSLTEFYHTVRKKSILPGSRMRGMPITPRHLEGIIRLAEASAKIRLSEKVEKEDFKLAKEIFIESLFKLGLDKESGTLDMARLGMGKTLSKKRKAQLMVGIIKEFLEKNKITSVTDKVLREVCSEKGIDKYEYDELINEINKEGEILYSKEGWKLPN